MATQRGRPVNPKSKLARARAVFNKRTPRQDMLKVFVKKIGLTPAGAKTYYQLCRNG
jgi:hypothetical protein